MAHDLYRKKDKMELAKTNPRSQSFGGLSSGDVQYKNYLLGMKPRVKTPENDRAAESTRAASNNFRLSAGVNDLQEDVEKIRASRALYAEMSSVPTKKTTKPKPTLERTKSSSFDQEDNVETMPSVGKLRSMFDVSSSDATIHDTNTTQLRNNAPNMKRDNLKRHSAFEPLQKPNNQIKKIDVNVIGRVKLNVDDMINDGKNEDEMTAATDHKSNLNIDAMVSVDNNNKAEIENSNDRTNINSTTNSKNTSSDINHSSVPISKTKGMHGLLQRKGSEFDDFEDRVVPTGIKTIDINYLLAPAPSDGNNNHQHSNSPHENTKPDDINFDLQKKRELDRLIQAQKDVNIHKAFNIKRRTLKDKLSEMYSMNQDSFDHGVVPYESESQPAEQPSINIDSYVNLSQSQVNIAAESSKISSTIDTDDKHCEIINEYVVICGLQESPQFIPEVVDTNGISIDGNKINDISLDYSPHSKEIVNDNLSYVDGGIETGLPVEVLAEKVNELNINIFNSEEVGDNVNIAVDKEKPGLTDSGKMNILLNESTDDESEDKLYGSIVERFDAFLTSHGISDPDILSPVSISDVEMDVNKVLTSILDGRLETSDDHSSIDGRISNAGSNDISLVDDEISNDISDLSLVDEKIFDDLSLIDDTKNKSIDFSHVDNVPTTKPSEMSLMNEIFGQLENKEFESNDNNLLMNNHKGNEAKLILPSIPKITKQDKVDLTSPTILDPSLSFSIGANCPEDAQDHTYKTTVSNLVEDCIVPESDVNVLASTPCTETVVVAKSNVEDPACKILTSSVEAPPTTNVADVALIGESSINNTENLLAALSIADDNKTVREAKQGAKIQAIMPKKSNLTRSKGSGPKKVNFRDPLSNDVIVTYGPTEYDRANADIDPIASSAEWELEKRVDKMDVFSVDLQKDERGLGLSIIGLGVGTESGVEKLGIFVKTLTENGASQKDGRIQVNDQILEVNGISLVGVTQYFAAQTLKNTDGIVRFLMGREKSRRSQYSPGSALATNPEMHKHIEEMNKVLQQLEEFEDRAINAEGTLEDVKLELLKAEERAHDAEHQLKDTKEQLTAVTESPFVGSTRKLKNEIKKKAGKHDKKDSLQRSLTDVTNRLSTSEENLTELQNQNGNKDNQITLLQQKISDQDCQLAEMENSGKFLHNELGCKVVEMNTLRLENGQLKEQVVEMNTLRLENGQLKEQLEEISGIHKLEKENLAHMQVEMAVKTVGDAEEIENTAKRLENENKCLKDEILALSGRLEINEQLLKEVTESEHDNIQLEHLHYQISEYKAEVEHSKQINSNMEDDINTLKEKNEYLQSLIMKLERKEELGTDIELKFKDKEEEYIKENDMLREKISDLEEQLRFPQRELTRDISPTLPMRSYINVGGFTDATAPPEFSRQKKPSAQNNDEDTNLLSNDSGIESINNIDDIVNFNLNPNPVPKPERGNFISVSGDLSPAVHNDSKPFIFDDSKGVVNLEDPECEPGDITPYIIEPSDSDLNFAVSANVAEIKEEVKIDVGSTEGIVTNTSNSSTPIITTNRNLKISTELSFDLDDLPEGKIDNDSDEDQGQFQLIQEDIEEEQQTPAPTNRTIRIHSDISDNRKYPNATVGDLDSSLLTDGNFDQWLGKDWSRLDSTAREEHADMIAAQVTAETPSARKFSRTSSTSSEESIDKNNKNIDKPSRVHSIKIDPAYFEQSHVEETSFDDDGSFDELDKAVNDNVVEITPQVDITGDLTKSLSFDSAIPPTAVLDNKVALDKKAIMNNQRAKPSRSPRVAVSENVTFRQVNGSESHTSTLPRPSFKANSKLKAAQSVPNLSMLPDSEKPSKRKHKYAFHLPKAFKKSKLGKRLSHESFNKKDTMLSFSDSDLTSNPESQTLSEEHIPPPTPSGNTEAAVVPMEEKTAALNLERANDAATEEAVVPFADKEMLMTTSNSDPQLSLHITSGHKSSPSISPTSLQNHANLEFDSSPSISPVRSLSDPHHGNRVNGHSERASINSSPGRRRHKDSSMEIEFSSFTSSQMEEGSTSPEFYNERGVDVEITNGHTEENPNYKTQLVTQWNIRQVGLWLTEINMAEYVNGFKMHNVDGSHLLRADGRELKEYGVHNHDHRALIKKHIREFRMKFGKSGLAKLKDHKSTRDKLQFWKGKYKLN